MPEYLTPGLYVEEIDSGSKPIEGVGTNTCAFIGYAKSGEFNKPTFISSWTQFCQLFGEDENALVTSLAQSSGKAPREIASMKKASNRGWTEFAMRIVDDAVRRDNPLKTPDGQIVKNFQEFTKAYPIPDKPTAYMEGSYLAHAVFGFFLNGGGRAYIVRTARQEDIEVYSDEAPIVTSAPPAAAPAKAIEPPRKAIGPMTFTAKEAQAGDVVLELIPVEGDEFRLKITQGGKEEIWPATDGRMRVGGVKEAVKTSTLVAVEVSNARFTVAPMQETLAMPLPVAPAELIPTAPSALAPSGGKSPITGVRADDFVGDEAQRTGVYGCAVIDDINMICMPDLMAGLFQREMIPTMAGTEEEGEEEIVLSDARRQAILALQVGLVQYCEKMGDRDAIIDPIPGLSAQEMRDITNATPYGCEKGHAAIYYPWIKVSDPLRKGKQLFVPPCGHVAGVWARVGSERGVHKAPANEVLRGAVALETDLTRGDQAILNPDGINAIRMFPGEGIKVYGARTLATRGNASWKYVNVRRLFNYLESSVKRGMTWAVFEPNDADLWSRLRRNISSFLYVAWREGMLFGESPSSAYYVRCDAENNPQATIDLGHVYVEVGINPVKPAEFVIIRMGQWDGGASTTEGA